MSLPKPRLHVATLHRALKPSSTSTFLPHHHHRRSISTSPPSLMADKSTLTESEIKRNPHPDFHKVQSSRPPWDTSSTFHFTQTASPSWAFGSGPNTTQPPPKPHVQIDPYAPDRPPAFNYKLLISGVIPRPIAFVSTRSKDGTTTNLAPFSYFQVVNHDPPLFTIGFASGLENSKDTLRNLVETEECVINIISEGFVEAANATSVNAPYGASEWAVSGLTAVYDCADVKAARVREAVFSIEGRLESVREFESRVKKGRKTGTLAIVEGTRFWVREDAINEERNLIDPAVLKPMSRLGGISYGRTTEAVEILRPDFEKDVGGQEEYDKLEEESAAKHTQSDGKL